MLACYFLSVLFHFYEAKTFHIIFNGACEISQTIIQLVQNRAESIFFNYLTLYTMGKKAYYSSELTVKYKSRNYEHNGIWNVYTK